MNPSPSYNHQKIVLNLLYELESLSRQGTGWEVLPGIGAKLSDINMPVPDVLVRPMRAASHFCDDMIVAFEVLSPSSRSTDLRWKRAAYPKMPSVQHYVVLHQEEVLVRCYDRVTGWAERRVEALDAIVDLQSIGAHLRLRELYANTGL